jgi:hypothetical protein
MCWSNAQSGGLIVAARDWDALGRQAIGHLGQFQVLVNVDTLNLRNAITALRLRVAENGLTPREQANPVMTEALQWVLDRGPQRVDALSVVSFWSALEVLVEDSFVVYCAALPDLTEVDAISRIKVPLAQFAEMTEDERYLSLWGALESGERGSAVDRWDAAFGHLGLQIDVEAVQRAPGWPERTNASVRATLRELQQVRNAILHRGGRADRRLEQFSQGRFTTGQEVVLTDEVVDKYGRGAIDYGTAANYAVVTSIEQLGAPPAVPE